MTAGSICGGSHDSRAMVLWNSRSCIQLWEHRRSNLPPPRSPQQQAQTGLPANETKAAFTSVTSARDLPNGIEVTSGSATMIVTALRDDVLRIRASATSTLPEDASWAVATETRAEKHRCRTPQRRKLRRLPHQTPRRPHRPRHRAPRHLRPERQRHQRRRARPQHHL